MTCISSTATTMDDAERSARPRHIPNRPTESPASQACSPVPGVDPAGTGVRVAFQGHDRERPQAAARNFLRHRVLHRPVGCQGRQQRENLGLGGD